MRHLVGRVIYAVIIFLLALGALEDLLMIAMDASGRDPGDPKHLAVRKSYHFGFALLAVGVALYEGITQKGLAGIRTFMQRREHFAALPPLGYELRYARKGDIAAIHALARSRYDRYSFPRKRLMEWFEANEYCFFVLHKGQEVHAYVDAFSISGDDFQKLRRGRPEQEIRPQTPDDVDEKSYFYVASYVVRDAYAGAASEFHKAAIEAYRTIYSGKMRWRAVIAAGVTRGTEQALRQLGMDRLDWNRKEHGNELPEEPDGFRRIIADCQRFWDRIRWSVWRTVRGTQRMFIVSRDDVKALEPDLQKLWMNFFSDAASSVRPQVDPGVHPAKTEVTAQAGDRSSSATPSRPERGTEGGVGAEEGVRDTG